MTPAIRDRDIIINKDYFEILEYEGLTSFNSIMKYSGGECLKKKREVSVHRIRLKDHTFYIKRYRVSLKNLLEWLFKLKYIDRDGLKEWGNIHTIGTIGINTVTPVAAGRRRSSFFCSESFILTEELYEARRLDEFFRESFMPPNNKEMVELKRKIILMVSNIVKRLHEKGLSHQDLYLTHFYIRFIKEGTFELFLIDLQRVRESGNAITRMRHRIKDLSQLLFASYYEIPVSILDRFRFYKAYVGGNRLTSTDRVLFYLVLKRARRIARHTRKHSYPVPSISWEPKI